ncbi:Calcium-binding protein 4 [Frankliniella fusca]|uniref:Calcium-binding protein 4 n=1 Tax=Frankliniella fusca TaxID=407009 RepID=A0AAE1HXG4_9NEOP|nr:Calcium-binding protein 4 [Frankliniella fusca]
MKEEEDNIVSNVSKWLKKNAPAVGINCDDYLASEEATISVSITVDEHGDWHAKIKCPAVDCNETYKVGRKDKNWVPSNLYRHILKSHVLKPATDSQQKTVRELFQRKKRMRLERNVEDSDEQTGTQTAVEVHSQGNSESSTSSTLESGDPERPTQQASAKSLRNRPGRFEEDLDEMPDKNFQKRDWSSQSPSERVKRKLRVASTDCRKIEDYFTVLNKIELLLKENESLRQQLTSTFKSVTDSKVQIDNSNLLAILLESAKINAGKKARGRRYNNHTLREFCTLVFVLGGPQLYEILSKNLLLPSVTVCRNNLVSNETIQEGVFRFHELKRYMLSQGYTTNKVLISEDGTVVNGRIEYDIKTNQLVGFVLPLRNGVPVAISFPAVSAHAMRSYFENHVACKTVYVIMAQPLVHKSSPFCLALFGTDNKFLHTDVLARWKWMDQAAAEAGIEIVCRYSDGDGKLLRAMIISLFSNTERCKKWPWFHASLDVSDHNIVMQDTIHLLVKLKSKLLKPSEIIPLGKHHLASRGDIAALIDNVSRDHHDLVPSVLNQRDKMNFRMAQKLCAEIVCESLTENITGAEATVIYLNMMREFCSAFLEVSLDAVERIFRAFKWIFFLRLWRQWIDKTDGYSVSHNFITSNSYSCIEINAHSLVLLIRRFRDLEEPEHFLPWLFSSQGCEEFFRKSRAMSPTQSTMVTYSVLDLQHRVRRIDFLSQTFCNLDNVIEYPRLKKMLKNGDQRSTVSQILPEDYVIEETVQKAFKEALKVCEKVKIAPKNAKIPPCPLPVLSCDSSVLEDLIEDPDLDIDENVATFGDGTEDSSVEENLQDEELDDAAEDLLIVSTGQLGIKSFKDVDVSPTSPFVVVSDAQGTPCIIKKTTLLYLLRTGDTRLSSDRLLRVQEDKIDRTTSRANQTALAATQRVKEDEISVGQWCAFQSENNSLIIARILAFSYLSGSSWRNQQYSSSSAPVQAPNPNKKRGLGVLCNWYNVQKNGRLIAVSMDLHGYYPIENYLCTIPRPLILSNKTLSLACPLKEIKKFISK